MTGVQGLLTGTMAWQRLRHRVTLLVSERENSTFTGFLRLPTQFDALTGPVIDHLRSRHPSHALRIASLGCSNGAEAYTIAAVLTRRRPDVGFTVRAVDLSSDCVRKARSARYQAEEIWNNKILPESFVADTFDRDGDDYVVRGDIARRVECVVGDVLSPSLMTDVGPRHIVFAQNFIFHMRPALARRALEQIARLLLPGGVIFLDGVDLTLRQAFVRRHRLVPLDYEIARIHDEARRARSVGWPYSYWGLEPFLSSRRDWRRRYATVFLAP